MFWSHPLCPCFIFVCFEHSFTLHNTPHEHHVMAKKKKQLNFLLKERPYCFSSHVFRRIRSCVKTKKTKREDRHLWTAVEDAIPSWATKPIICDNFVAGFLMKGRSLVAVKEQEV